MSFRRDFPDYETYQDGPLYYKKVPQPVVAAVKGLILRIAESPQNLKAICNDIASRVPCEPTQNWGWDWLVNDLDDMLEQLAARKLHKFMDFIYDLASNHVSSEFIEDLNDIFEEYDFGYRIALDDSRYGGDYYWDIYKEPERVEESVAVAVLETEDVCAQTNAHLDQARGQLRTMGSQRAIKDALRDCLSAMEALVKKLGGSPELRASITALRGEKRWGPDIILRDGLGIWDRVHELHPDVRHGTPETSEITKEEALYWIDRLMAYVNYLSRRKRAMSNS